MNKASRGDRIPAELFKILKDDVVKELHSICQQIWKTQQWPQDWKRSVFIPIPKKGNAKECSNYHTIVLISHASKVMLKILQARLQQLEKAMATHSSTLAWNIPWTEDPGRLQSMGLQQVGQDWVTSLSLFTFMHWRRKWQPTPVFLPGESQGRRSLVGSSMGSHRVRHNWSDLAAAAAGFNSRWISNFQMFKLDLEKAEEPDIKLPTSFGSQIKQESSRKTSTSASLTMPKPLTVWITTSCGKFLKRWDYHTTWTAPWETCMHVKKQQLKLDLEQWTGSKLGKEYIKVVYCQLAYLTYIICRV